MFELHSLAASLWWGTVGSAYGIYGWRQRSGIPLAGGIAMMAVSYLIDSALLMSLACLGLIAAVHWLLRRSGS